MCKYEYDLDAMWADYHAALAELNKPEPLPKKSAYTCPHEDVRMEREHGAVVCAECGLVLADHIFVDAYNNLITGEKPGKVSMYKRKHHFNERIAQWTVARERVPSSVVDAVTARIKGAVTKTTIRTVLREIGQRKHIENWIEIYCKITKTPYPAPDAYKLECMKSLFSKYEVAFEKLRPVYRKAMLNYNYIFVRLLQTVDMPDQFKWFPPLKSRVKLRVLDAVFDDMCHYLGFEPVPLPNGRSLR